MFTYFSFVITSLQSICERYFDIKLVRLLDMDIMDLFKTVSIFVSEIWSIRKCRVYI